MKKATYINKATGETYVLAGVKDMEHAWNMSKFVCSRNNWNHSMFHLDVIVKVS